MSEQNQNVHINSQTGQLTNVSEQIGSNQTEDSLRIQSIHQQYHQPYLLNSQNHSQIPFSSVIQPMTNQRNLFPINNNRLPNKFTGYQNTSFYASSTYQPINSQPYPTNQIYIHPNYRHLNRQLTDYSASQGYHAINLSTKVQVDNSIIDEQNNFKPNQSSASPVERSNLSNNIKDDLIQDKANFEQITSLNVHPISQQSSTLQPESSIDEITDTQLIEQSTNSTKLTKNSQLSKLTNISQFSLPDSMIRSAYTPPVFNAIHNEHQIISRVGPQTATQIQPDQIDTEIASNTQTDLLNVSKTITNDHSSPNNHQIVDKNTSTNQNLIINAENSGKTVIENQPHIQTKLNLSDLMLLKRKEGLKKLNQMIEEIKSSEDELSVAVTVDLDGTNLNDDLTKYLVTLDRIKESLESFFSISQSIKAQVNNLRKRILLFEKMDYESDKALFNFLKNTKKEKYMEKLKPVKEALDQIRIYEKMLEDNVEKSSDCS